MASLEITTEGGQTVQGPICTMNSTIVVKTQTQEQNVQHPKQFVQVVAALGWGCFSGSGWCSLSVSEIASNEPVVILTPSLSVSPVKLYFRQK